MKNKNAQIAQLLAFEPAKRLSQFETSDAKTDKTEPELLQQLHKVYHAS